MWTSTASVAAWCFITGLLQGLPLIFMESRAQRVAYVLVMVPVLATIGTGLFYALVPEELNVIAKALEACTRPFAHGRVFPPRAPTAERDDDEHSDQEADALAASLQLTAENRRRMNAVAATAFHSDIFVLQARARDAIASYLRQRQAIEAGFGGPLPQPAATTAAPGSAIQFDREGNRLYNGRPRLLPATGGAAADASVTAIDHATADEFTAASREDDDASCASATSQEGSRPRQLVSTPPPSQPQGPIIVRGTRFQGDTPYVCMYIERSKNANVVVYEARVERDLAGNVAGLPLTDPLDAYWLDIDAAYVKKARKAGKMHDREELNSLEKRMAYGIKCKRRLDPAGSTSDAVEFNVKCVALESRPFVLRVITAHLLPNDDAHFTRYPVTNVPVLTTAINGQQAAVSRLFVQAAETILLPKVEYVELHGVSLADGSAVTERITP